MGILLSCEVGLWIIIIYEIKKIDGIRQTY